MHSFLFVLLFSLSASIISSQSIQEKIKISCINTESFTQPFNRVVKDIKFGIENPCTVMMVVYENNVNDQSINREIHYTFEAQNVNIKSKWTLENGFLNVPMLSAEDLQISILKNGIFVKNANSQIIEIPSSKDNYALVDGIEQLAEFCLNK